MTAPKPRKPQRQLTPQELAEVHALPDDALRLDAGLERRGITDRLQRWKLGHSNSPAIDVELTAET